MLIAFISLGILLLADATASPAAQTQRASQTTTIHARANGQSYVVSVAVPQNYASTEGTSYPVVYLLDSDWYFDLTVGIQRVLTAMQAIRPAIIVGIGYGGTDISQHRARRFREMTPTAVPAQPGSGQADGFMAALKEDIIPYIEGRFRTSPERFLVGHSLGGLFTAAVLVRQPSLFTGYGVLSPSLWWDDNVLIAEEEQRRRTGGVRQWRAFLGVGSEEGDRMVVPFKAFAAALKSDAYRGLASAGRIVEGTGHVGVIPGGISMALEWLLGRPAPPVNR